MIVLIIRATNAIVAVNPEGINELDLTQRKAMKPANTNSIPEILIKQIF